MLRCILLCWHESALVRCFFSWLSMLNLQQKSFRLSLSLFFWLCLFTSVLCNIISGIFSIRSGYMSKTGMKTMLVYPSSYYISSHVSSGFTFWILTSTWWYGEVLPLTQAQILWASWPSAVVFVTISSLCICSLDVLPRLFQHIWKALSHFNVTLPLGTTPDP